MRWNDDPERKICLHCNFYLYIKSMWYDLKEGCAMELRQPITFILDRTYTHVKCVFIVIFDE